MLSSASNPLVLYDDLISQSDIEGLKFFLRFDPSITSEIMQNLWIKAQETGNKEMINLLSPPEGEADAKKAVSISPVNKSPRPIYGMKKVLTSAFKSAKEIYQAEDRSPGRDSLLVGQFGWFSSWRHSSPPVEFETKLMTCKNEDSAKQLTIAHLQKTGCLWNEKGHRHSFNNYFLTCLRNQDIVVYRQIIGEAFSIKFAVGPLTLYRRDTRGPEEIFKSGFTLKEAKNAYHTRKSNYSEPATREHGISCSRTRIGEEWGKFEYIIQLPEGCDLLMIDILGSKNNQERLKDDPYTYMLSEVNSMDDISPTFIKGVYTEKPGEKGIFTENLGFNRISHSSTPRVCRGCY